MTVIGAALDGPHPSVPDTHSSSCSDAARKATFQSLTEVAPEDSLGERYPSRPGPRQSCSTYDSQSPQYQRGCLRIHSRRTGARGLRRALYPAGSEASPQGPFDRTAQIHLHAQPGDNM